MNPTYEDYQLMLTDLRKITTFKPLIGAVLGSGLGDFANEIKVEAIVPYQELPGLPKSTNKVHKGQYVFGYLDDIPVVLMQGRLHCYEGYSSQEVVAPIRLMGLMGIKKLVLSNAAGAVNTNFHPGDLMLIDDQIACLISSPLRGPNIDEFGTRFPDMSEVYDQKDTDIIYEKAKKLNLPVQRGVYMQFYGPQFESKAEVRLARTLGADACGMSTAIEAIASSHMGIKTVGISLLANMACGITKKKITDAEVIIGANKAKNNVTLLLKEAIKELAYGK
ncbi:MAG: purine-nucleoside phosphorylase [Bacilli bacterium]|jgi:purine-nucleoside phosphorylase